MLDLGEPAALAPPDYADAREENDFYPTPPEPTRALLRAEGEAIRAHGSTVWEPAVGDGAMAREIVRSGFAVTSSDIVDRGWPMAQRASFFDCPMLAPVIITNPPYFAINARDSGGAWVRRQAELGVRYSALLLNWDWPAAVQNGLAQTLADHPFARVYLCRWKIDFTGKGAPPQRNAWFVWDANAAPGAPRMLYLDRRDGRGW